ncbi:Delta-aminolevulinic acid dehydratase [Dermatophilus congolensis]|uniref:Delta-aminolevulinic acid dehydratase n=1 Tax=Dermatophilus congolensis TaxID=1863 RepID=A0AA46BL32_9MICO|nr:porphobilinogen synthase [Dermatophilus congolensis]STD02867.1 Delta-aminolevulinic acid dehydratase [Dermatophilus congolensis]
MNDNHEPLRRRPRRLRSTPAIRRLVAETRLHPAQLILPVFIAEDTDHPTAITSMPGVVQHCMDSLLTTAREAANAGIGGIMLFGVPTHKDATGSGADDPNGILNTALSRVRDTVGDDLLVMADTCLDEFTDHGHCGVLATDSRGNTYVDNDATLERYASMAVSQANAGAHIVGPSGMMDGQIGVIRDALDQAGHTDTIILAYSAKYASAYYGPFREAVSSSLTGDRKTYQQDPANIAESLLETELDIEQGADIVMVKPGMPYLDVLATIAANVNVPVCSYQVSGEYAMLEAAAANGWIDRDRAILESLTCLNRAGAGSILTYHALHAAHLLG